MPTRTANRPRRKAKQERSRQTVKGLLEAAARVLEQHGYARATTNRIARTAGASIGTLYEYFPNKETIYEALVEQEIESIRAAIASADLDLDAPLDESLIRILVLGMSAMRRGPDFTRSLEQVPGAVFRRHLAVARQSVIGFIRELLEAHRNELQVTDLDLAAFIVVSAAEGIGANVTEENFDRRLAKEISTLLTLYLTSERPG